MPSDPHPTEVLDFLDFVHKHGGPRTPGPGRKQGRPAKKPTQKAVCTTLTLSSRKTLKTLQKRAKKANLTPGAYIEQELNLAPTSLVKLQRKLAAVNQKILKAQGVFDLEKVTKLTKKQIELERAIIQFSYGPQKLAPA